MDTPATGAPDNKPRPPKAGPGEDGLKRWLGVGIAVVALLVSVATFLQADASNHNAQLSRHAQENAIASTGARTRGQQEAAFGEFVMAREYDELTAEARRLDENGDALGASAYLTASQQIVNLSPMLGPSYSSYNKKGLRTSDESRYEADLWVVTSTLLSERREAAARLLENHPIIEKIEARESRLYVTLKPDTTDYSELATLLVQNGHKLALLKEDELNLETAFMALTKGITA